MLNIVNALFLAFRSSFRTRPNLVLENLALRQQLVVAKRHMKRSSLKTVDRLFWVVGSLSLAPLDQAATAALQLWSSGPAIDELHRWGSTPPDGYRPQEFAGASFGPGAERPGGSVRRASPLAWRPAKGVSR